MVRLGSRMVTLVRQPPPRRSPFKWDDRFEQNANLRPSPGLVDYFRTTTRCLLQAMGGRGGIASASNRAREKYGLGWPFDW